MLSGYDEITPDEAHGRFRTLHPVDIRAEHEFDGPLGHVPGSVLIPLPELDRRIADLPDGRPLLLVCRSGNRSGKACARLAALSIGPVINLAGGMIEWNRDRLPIEQHIPRSLDELIENVVAWMTQVGSLDRDGVRSVLRRRMAQLDESLDQPKSEAVSKLLDFVEESLGQSGLPDLDLSMDYFRRSLRSL